MFKQRDAFFDNAKYLAIVLVALGHIWGPLKDDSRSVHAAYLVVYAFHMPAFIVISGFFSRSFEMRPHQIRRLITGIAVPYVIFETAYALFVRVMQDDPDHRITLLDPWFLTWFLAALFVWRLTTPIWKAVRWPLPLAFGIAMLASMTPGLGEDLDMQRVLQFLPYFVLGLCLKPEHFQLVRRRSVRIAAVPVFAGAVLFAWWAAPRMNPAWLRHRDAAQELGVAWWTGPVMTAALFCCSVLLMACFFAWVPGRRTWFTTLGAGTLYGYLLHGFVTKTVDFRGWDEEAWMQGPLGTVLVTVVAAVGITLMCSGPVQRVLRFAVEPRMDWAFRREQPAEPGKTAEAGQTAEAAPGAGQERGAQAGPGEERGRASAGV